MQCSMCINYMKPHVASAQRDGPGFSISVWLDNLEIQGNVPDDFRTLARSLQQAADELEAADDSVARVTGR